MTDEASLWREDMLQRVANEMAMHVDLDGNGIASGNDIDAIAERIAGDDGYRKAFGTMVAITKAVTDDVVGRR